MIILGSNNTVRIKHLVLGIGGQTIKYYVLSNPFSSGIDTVGYLELDQETNEWAIEQKPVFSMTVVFLRKIWLSLISCIEEEVQILEGEQSGTL